MEKHRTKIASLRIGKHRIVKKNRHRPPLKGNGYWATWAVNEFMCKLYYLADGDIRETIIVRMIYSIWNQLNLCFSSLSVEAKLVKYISRFLANNLLFLWQYDDWRDVQHFQTRWSSLVQRWSSASSPREISSRHWLVSLCSFKDFGQSARVFEREQRLSGWKSFSWRKL